MARDDRFGRKFRLGLLLFYFAAGPCGGIAGAAIPRDVSATPPFRKLTDLGQHALYSMSLLQAQRGNPDKMMSALQNHVKSRPVAERDDALIAATFVGLPLGNAGAFLSATSALQAQAHPVADQMAWTMVDLRNSLIRRGVGGMFFRGIPNALGENFDVENPNHERQFRQWARLMFDGEDSGLSREDVDIPIDVAPLRGRHLSTSRRNLYRRSAFNSGAQFSDLEEFRETLESARTSAALARVFEIYYGGFAFRVDPGNPVGDVVCARVLAIIKSFQWDRRVFEPAIAAYVRLNGFSHQAFDTVEDYLKRSPNDRAFRYARNLRRRIWPTESD